MHYSLLLIFTLCIFNIQSVYSKKVLQGPFPKYYSTLKENISKKELALIKAGYSLFSKPWVQAPSSTKLRDGLGPHFSANSCISCHQGLGRGKPVFKSNIVHHSLVFRLEDHTGSPDLNYGDQITTQAIPGIKPEAKITIKYHSIKKYYTDKTSYTLSVPKYKFENLSHGPIGVHTNFSPRIAPHLSGLGEIERIDPKQILLKHDPFDHDQDGISGKVNWASNTQHKSIGRFGWKANRPTLQLQNAAAFRNDMSITSHFFPQESCSLNQFECMSSLNGGAPEISRKHLSYITLMLKNIAPPQSDTTKYQRGKKLFKQVRCTSCHTPSYTLKNNEVISPYTDLLLHDMGDQLSDQSSSDLAREWKTPPLWGIGKQHLVNGHTHFLHDGRAKSIEEAILWHGGEALKSKNLFINLTKNERTELLNFVKSL